MVPPDHPDSNFGMAHRALLRHVDVLPSQVHRVLGELSRPSAAADAYDNELRTAFADAPTEPAPDVTLLASAKTRTSRRSSPAAPCSTAAGQRAAGPGSTCGSPERLADHDDPATVAGLSIDRGADGGIGEGGRGSGRDRSAPDITECRRSCSGVLVLG
jgi:hypothetical protein